MDRYRRLGCCRRFADKGPFILEVEILFGGVLWSGARRRKRLSWAGPPPCGFTNELPQGHTKPASGARRAHITVQIYDAGYYSNSPIHRIWRIYLKNSVIDIPGICLPASPAASLTETPPLRSELKPKKVISRTFQPANPRFRNMLRPDIYDTTRTEMKSIRHPKIRPHGKDALQRIPDLELLHDGTEPVVTVSTLFLITTPFPLMDM